MASLSLKNVTKKYPNGFVAVKDFNLEIADKEFIIFVGPSGCGKSTTLRMIAGLEDISSGELYIDGKLVNDVEPKDRDIAMVFQNYALYLSNFCLIITKNFGYYVSWFLSSINPSPKTSRASLTIKNALGSYSDTISFISTISFWRYHHRRWYRSCTGRRLHYSGNRYAGRSDPGKIPPLFRCADHAGIRTSPKTAAFL